MGKDFLLAQISNKKAIAKKEYGRFVRSRISQGHREDFYELTDKHFLGTEEFAEDIRRDLNEKTSFVYAISMQRKRRAEPTFKWDGVGPR